MSTTGAPGPPAGEIPEYPSDTPLTASIGEARCAHCGMGVHQDEEARVVCDGCGNTTEACTCEPQS
jgi:hypothetical protein